MVKSLFALAAGFLFGIGLIVSGMANPRKVLGFLDVAGAWDPSLAMVMIGAIGIGFLAFALAARRGTSLLGAAMQLPTARHIDWRLVFGSALFGVGWGLVGFCPGPALVALGAGHVEALVFVAAMLGGLAIFEWIERARTKRRDAFVAQRIVAD
ncbi:MAG TPA: DUF6691 family protein [Casimicrobiaceae bacterium]|nr:DUF6691 family protein [Casimicrobiaceae bacterium]